MIIILIFILNFKKSNGWQHSAIMNRPQNRRAKSEPIRRFLKSVPEGIRHASAPARLASERIYAKLVQLKRDYNESITVISSIWTNGCGIGIVTVPWALEKGRVNI